MEKDTLKIVVLAGVVLLMIGGFIIYAFATGDLTTPLQVIGYCYGGERIITGVTMIAGATLDLLA